MNDWHTLAASDLAADEVEQAAGCMDDVLALYGVDPYTPVDRLPERGSWALVTYMIEGYDE